MKAVMYDAYGSPDVVRLQEVDDPTPKDDEVLIRVRATTVATAEMAGRKGDPFIARLFTGLRRPKKIPGSELAGEITATGNDVRKFGEGDQVVAATGADLGAHAEYICVAEDGPLAKKPPGATFEEAVVVCEGGLTALPFLRDKGRIQHGHRVLINGASGAVGTAAVQLAKHFGAEVTGVCSTGNLDLVRSLGADEILDYTAVDFTRTGETYDIIFDVAGKSSYRRCRRSLNDGGAYLTTVPTFAIFPQMLWTSKIGRRRAAIAFTGLRPPRDKARDLVILGELMERGAIRPVIDRSYPLEETAEAHRHVETGPKRGSVVLTP